MRLGKSIPDIFREGKNYKYLLLSVLITGLSYGLYKGMLDNFLAEVVRMGEMDRGITEFFRELPGIALVFILALFYMLSAETLYKVGAVIMLIGMGMHAALPATKVLTTLAICMYSLGEHIQIGMKSTLSLEYAKPGKGGAAQGIQGSANQIGTLVGYLVIVLAFSLVTKDQPYRLFFAVAAGLAALSALCSGKITGKSQHRLPVCAGRGDAAGHHGMRLYPPRSHGGRRPWHQRHHPAVRPENRRQACDIHSHCIPC